MHAEDFRKDLYGVVSGLRDGGYSDDMTLAAIAGNCSEIFLVINHPKQVFILMKWIYGIFLMYYSPPELALHDFYNYLEILSET